MIINVIKLWGCCQSEDNAVTLQNPRFVAFGDVYETRMS